MYKKFFLTFIILLSLSGLVFTSALMTEWRLYPFGQPFEKTALSLKRIARSSITTLEDRGAFAALGHMFSGIEEIADNKNRTIVGVQHIIAAQFTDMSSVLKTYTETVAAPGHIADLDKGMMGANGIVGGGPPLICGAALAKKTLKTGGIAIAFVGDGGSNQGTTFESLNLATIWNLPCIFVVENNGYAESTSSKWSVSLSGNATDRAAGFGMPGVEVDGHDFFAVYEAAGEAIERARNGGGPTLLECKLNRYYGHFEGDAQTYRPQNEVKNIRETKDCLELFHKKVTSDGIIDVSELNAIDEKVMKLIEQSVVEAKAAPKPAEEELLTDVYVSY